MVERKLCQVYRRGTHYPRLEAQIAAILRDVAKLST